MSTLPLSSVISLKLSSNVPHFCVLNKINDTYRYFCCSNTVCKNKVVVTVEPLTNDHPHQRPSLSYDHISCDGQWFLFVYESLTSDHPSYTTTPMWFWGWSYNRGSTVLQCSHRGLFIERKFHSIIEAMASTRCTAVLPVTHSGCDKNTRWRFSVHFIVRWRDCCLSRFFDCTCWHVQLYVFLSDTFRTPKLV